MAAGERPTHRVEIRSKNKDGPCNLNAGAAWANPIGGLTLRLSPGVTIDARVTDEYYVNVNPIDWEYHDQQRTRRPARAAARDSHREDPDDIGAGDELDDIPFG